MMNTGFCGGGALPLPEVGVPKGAFRSRTLVFVRGANRCGAAGVAVRNVDVGTVGGGGNKTPKTGRSTDCSGRDCPALPGSAEKVFPTLLSAALMTVTLVARHGATSPALAQATSLYVNWSSARLPSGRTVIPAIVQPRPAGCAQVDNGQGCGRWSRCGIDRNAKTAI